MVEVPELVLQEGRINRKYAVVLGGFLIKGLGFRVYDRQQPVLVSQAPFSCKIAMLLRLDT